MAQETESKEEGQPTEAGPGETSRVGKFIQTYHGFLSSFVIGAAGLIATSIWQFRQADIARRQSEAQQKVAETQAENNWKIEKADILSKNLQTLSAQGAGNVEQRYGVLLSLTRGNILDPELAVSYALELGKENPDYMRSVLANTSGKDYFRLAHSFEPTCEQRYGLTRPVPICNVDKLAERSAAIADLINDDYQAASLRKQPGPLVLLQDEHPVQSQATRMTWLFAPTLIRLYERRLWKDIQQFEGTSSGARLVSALVLSTARTGELVSQDEAARLEKFHADERKWLSQYLVGNTCDSECRGKLMEVMVSEYAESKGDFDQPVRTLLKRPRAQSGSAMSYLHLRLIWCQVDDDDLTMLRDRVLVPDATELINQAKGKEQQETAEDLVGLLALVPPPQEGPALDAWKAFNKALEAPGKEHYLKEFAERRAAATRERASPPPAARKLNFCNVPAPPERSTPAPKASAPEPSPSKSKTVSSTSKSAQH
jgi:hypothetical protein